MQTDARKIVSRLLIAFVLVSVGFAVGRQVGRRPGVSSAGGNPAAGQAGSQPAAQDKVIVYGMHATVRCAMCSQMEALTDSLIRDGFAAELASGRLEWKQVDFQENEDLARRYGVGASTLVVVKVRGGREVAFKRLDEVWTKLADEGEFIRYVADAIRLMLEGDGA